MIKFGTGFERLHQRGEARHVGKKRRDLAALGAQIVASLSLTSRCAKLGEK